MKPEFLKFDEKDFSGVTINDWNVLSYHKPISSAPNIEKYSKELGIGIPEMIFGENFLLIKHSITGLTINLNAYDALQHVKKGAESANEIKVNHAKLWKESNLSKKAGVTKVINPFDWTFSTDYPGTVSSHLSFRPTRGSIDYEKLKTFEPLLFFDQNTLFEDDLGDNGISSLSYKIRVMQSGIFVLMRFFLRVDGVLVRIWDTRYYFNFTSKTLIRERSKKECQFDDVKNKIPKSNSDNEDLSMLNDSNFVRGLMGEDPDFIENEMIEY